MHDPAFLFLHSLGNKILDFLSGNHTRGRIIVFPVPRVAALIGSGPGCDVRGDACWYWGLEVASATLKVSVRELLGQSLFAPFDRGAPPVVRWRWALRLYLGLFPPKATLALMTLCENASVGELRAQAWVFAHQVWQAGAWEVHLGERVCTDLVH